MKAWQAGFLALALAAGLLAATPGLSRAELKIGLDEVQLTGAKYTHDNAGTKSSDAATMVGTNFNLEWLPTGYFGLEVDYSLSPLERTYQLGTNGAVSNNVTEAASLLTYGFNLYFGRDERRGWHPVVGVATGTAAVTQKFEAGTLGAQSTHASVDLNILKLGVDWVLSYAGLRLQYQMWTGSKSNSTQLTGIRQTNDYTGSAIDIGVFADF
jgi:hypothetical protein